jgi:hypothetical protein
MWAWIVGAAETVGTAILGLSAGALLLILLIIGGIAAIIYVFA